MVDSWVVPGTPSRVRFSPDGRLVALDDLRGRGPLLHPGGAVDLDERAPRSVASDEDLERWTG